MTTPETTAIKVAERYRNSDIEALRGQLAALQPLSMGYVKTVLDLENEIEALRTQVADLKEELSSVLGDWNALVKAIGSPTNGGAIGHATALRAQVEQYRAALELIASPMRPDGTWNRDRAACQQIAREAIDKAGKV